jgi:hypothetical protein
VGRRSKWTVCGHRVVAARKPKWSTRIPARSARPRRAEFGVRAASCVSSRRLTASSWRTLPQQNARRNEPSVGRGPDPVEEPAQPGLAQQVQIIDGVRAGDHPGHHTPDLERGVRAQRAGHRHPSSSMSRASSARARCSAHDYSEPGKPRIAWDDAAARERLIDALVGDAHRLLGHLPDQEMGAKAAEAVALLALVAGQDVEPADGSEGTDGRWRIARKVPPDRVISTVDPQARHAHKARSRRQDGYKAHVVIEPDTGIITDTP